MAIKIGANLAYNGKLPNFERDSFKTKAAMKAFDENSIDEGHLSYCKEDGKVYQYKSANSIDTTTGKWRLFKTDIVVDATLNGTSKNPIQNKAVFEALKLKADAAALGAYQPKYNADYVAKADFNYSELPNGAKVVDLNGYTMTVNSTITIANRQFYNGIIRLSADGIVSQNNYYKNVDIHGYPILVYTYNEGGSNYWHCNIQSANIVTGTPLEYCAIRDSTIAASNENCFFTSLTRCIFNTNGTIGYGVNVDNKIYLKCVIKDGKPIEAGFELNKNIDGGNAFTK